MPSFNGQISRRREYQIFEVFLHFITSILQLLLHAIAELHTTHVVRNKNDHFTVVLGLAPLTTKIIESRNGWNLKRKKERIPSSRGRVHGVPTCQGILEPRPRDFYDLSFFPRKCSDTNCSRHSFLPPPPRILLLLLLLREGRPAPRTFMPEFKYMARLFFSPWRGNFFEKGGRREGGGRIVLKWRPRTYSPRISSETFRSISPYHPCYIHI